jgi:hypothetical protein
MSARDQAEKATTDPCQPKRAKPDANLEAIVVKLTEAVNVLTTKIKSL